MSTETVVHLNHEIDRKCTINIEVIREAKVEINEIFDALEQRAFLTYTKCLQQISRNKFRWSLATEEIAQRLLQELNEYEMDVGGDPTRVTYASRVQTYILYDTPYEMREEDLREIFEEFGQILTIKKTYHRTMPEILDGRMILTFLDVKKRPPSSIILGQSGKITIRLPGEKIRRQHCYKCGAIESHPPDECPESTKCHYCRETGHRYATCPKRVENDSQIPSKEQQSVGPKSPIIADSQPIANGQTDGNLNESFSDAQRMNYSGALAGNNRDDFPPAH